MPTLAGCGKVPKAAIEDEDLRDRTGPEAVFGECLLQAGLSWHYSTAIIRS
jgi:hypothetical protein